MPANNALRVTTSLLTAFAANADDRVRPLPRLSPRKNHRLGLSTCPTLGTTRSPLPCSPPLLPTPTTVSDLFLVSLHARIIVLGSLPALHWEDAAALSRVSPQRLFPSALTAASVYTAVSPLPTASTAPYCRTAPARRHIRCVLRLAHRSHLSSAAARSLSPSAALTPSTMEIAWHSRPICK
ncbi:hypothetical protein R3P38DRAFT_3187459 [Favolaschia claudopus]|uniref:Uncharacterized protein n=1 Tax=Favolaschia claudopus TaxID=2862362 RepID=A0AAW0BZU3_9AGAR